MALLVGIGGRLRDLGSHEGRKQSTTAMRKAFSMLLTLGILSATAQECPGVIEYMTGFGPCGRVSVPRFIVRAAIEGVDTSWYGTAGTDKDSVWAKVAWGWIEHSNDSLCPRERYVRYMPCDPTQPDTIRFSTFVNTNRNYVQTVDWKRVVQLRFTDMRITKLPPDYQRVAYLVGDNTGVRFMPDGRWKMSNGTYCGQYPDANTWKSGAVMPVATISFPAPVDIAYFLGRTSSGSSLQFEAATMEVLAMP